MNAVAKLFDSSIGQKIVAAATGLGLLGFVVVHMIGNLQLFVGQDAINAYAVKLKSLGPLLWIARLGLLALIVLHIAMTIRARYRNLSARGNRYQMMHHQRSTRSSRNMMISGSAILLFIVFHLAHFTFGWVQPEAYHLTDAAGRHDVYSMVLTGFQSWPISIFYVVAMLFLFSHISHAAFSAFQTLGISRTGDDRPKRRAAWWVAAATVAGFAALPLAVLLGIINNNQ